MGGMHLRRDAALPTHMSRGNWRPLQNPKRDSLWHHHLAGRVFLFSFTQLPLEECGTERGARTCANEGGGACLSAATRRRMERRRCITLR